MTGEPPPAPIAAPAPEPVPFWGYADVLLVAGLALPCMFVALLVVRLTIRLLHLHGLQLAAQAVPEMLIGYALLFLAVMLIFRMQYDRPFWRSLGWIPTRVPEAWFVVYGFGTSMAVGLIGIAIRTPSPKGPLIEMMKEPGALVLLAIFGTTAAPLFEELAFRGFLQPLLVRSLGAVAGIAIAAAIFGALHFSEYGNSWKSALLVGCSGVSFGILRQRTGSTRAAVIAHAAFNALPFLSLFTQGKTG